MTIVYHVSDDFPVRDLSRQLVCKLCGSSFLDRDPHFISGSMTDKEFEEGGGVIHTYTTYYRCDHPVAVAAAVHDS